MSMTSAKRGIRTLLLSQAFLAELEKAAAEIGVAAPPPFVIYRAVKAGPNSIDGFPCGELDGDESVPEDASGTVEDLNHRIAVLWTLVGDDEETLTDQVEVYVLATRRTLSSAHLPGVGNVPVVVGRENYSRLARVKDLAQPLVKGAALEVIVGTIE